MQAPAPARVQVPGLQPGCGVARSAPCSKIGSSLLPDFAREVACSLAGDIELVAQQAPALAKGLVLVLAPVQDQLG